MIVVLMGVTGSGKTTVGKVLAKKLESSGDTIRNCHSQH